MPLRKTDTEQWVERIRAMCKERNFTLPWTDAELFGWVAGGLTPYDSTEEDEVWEALMETIKENADEDAHD